MDPMQEVLLEGSKNPLGKRKKTTTWSHRFVCLASPKQQYIPDSNEKATLKMAGLGQETAMLSLLAEAWEVKKE